MSLSKIPSEYKGSVFTPSPPSIKLCRHKCIVPKCDSKYDDSTYHRFPKNKKLKKLWKRKCHLTKCKTVHFDLICGKHFLPSDYVKGKLTRLTTASKSKCYVFVTERGTGDCKKPKLLDNAIPSQHLPVN